MKQHINTPIIAMLAFVLFACSHGGSTTSDSHTSRTSLDWVGAYGGTLPCADCERIDVEIVLRSNATFTRSMLYVGRSTSPRIDSGSFAFDEKGALITLAGSTPREQRYRVEEQQLRQLAEHGTMIDGSLADSYVLRKLDPVAFLRRKNGWTLVSLAGKPLASYRYSKLPSLTIDGTRANGSGGCNSYFGEATISGTNSLRFGAVGSTKMACMNDDIESAFFAAIQNCRTFTIASNILSLRDEQGTPLATFSPAVPAP
jgi:heat shock protein HslJ